MKIHDVVIVVVTVTSFKYTKIITPLKIIIPEELLL